MSSLKGKSSTCDLENDLIQQIQAGELQPGDSILPIRELCKKYVISYNTARKGIGSLVDKGLLTSHRGKGVFVTESGASNTTKNIGFIYCTNFGELACDPFMVTVFNAIHKELARKRLNAISFAVDEVQQQEMRLPDFVLSKEVQGVLVMELVSLEYILAIARANIPILLLDNHILDGINAVSSDNLNSSLKAVQYLIDLGHHRIGCIYPTNPRLPHMPERLIGYKLALSESSLEYDGSIVQSADFVSDRGYEAMKNILKASPLPTAVFAGNDIIAINAMKAIKEHNLRIPEDISIIGFDDIDYALHADPPLTTMKVLKEEMGKIAVANLLAVIDGRMKRATHVKLMAELIERESCRRL